MQSEGSRHHGADTVEAYQKFEIEPRRTTSIQSNARTAPKAFSRAEARGQARKREGRTAGAKQVKDSNEGGVESRAKE